MAGYNNFPGPDSKIQYCVVGSDDGENKPDDNSCNQKYFSPLDHGADVSLDDLAFNPLSMSPTGFGQQAFPGIMDPGTPVLVLKQLGMNGGIALGQSNSKRQGNGSSKLGGNATVDKLASTKLNVNTAPDVREEEEDGVKIRKIVEKGKQHSLDLLDGLPMHGALFSMAGFRLPDVKKVPTAKQTNDQMMNGQALQQMMGQIMSMAQMIQGLAGRGGAGGGGGGYGAGFTGWGTGGNLNVGSLSESFIPNGAEAGAGGGLWDGGGLGANTISAIEAPEGTHMYDIMQNQTSEMRTAINSLSNLLQGLEVNSGVSYYTGDVVHEETYLQNARDLLMQVKNVDELMNVLHRLQWDTSLFGQEKLDNVVQQIETAWGVALQEIDVNGNVVITYGSEDANNEMSFLNSMTSNTGAPALGYFDNSTTDNKENYSTINGTGAYNNPLPSPVTVSPTQTSGGGRSSSSSPQQVASQIQGILGQVQGLAQGMGQNMFGEAAETMKDMWKRMTRDQEQDAKKMHEKLNQAEDTRKMSKIVEKTTKGGNPIDMESNEFDEGGLNGMGDSVGSGNFSVGFM